MKGQAWKVIHSSDDQCWRTPPEIFEPLNAEFGFQVDAAALANSALLPEWYGPDNPDESKRNALDADWGKRMVWLNPPYGREVGKWGKKAWLESTKGSFVVVLTMACTDTAWWHDYAWRASEIRLVRGRIRFLRADGSRANSAPKGSAILVFAPGHMGKETSAPRVVAYP